MSCTKPYNQKQNPYSQYTIGAIPKKEFQNEEDFLFQNQENYLYNEAFIFTDTIYSKKTSPYNLTDNPFSNKENPYSDACVTEVTFLVFQDDYLYRFQSGDRKILNML